MRRFRTLALIMVMTAVAAGCGGGGGDDTDTEVEPAPERPPLSTSAVPTTSGGTTVPTTNLTLRLADVRVANSEESDSGMRVLLPAGVATASVTVNGLPSPNRVISVCQAKELERRLSGAACRTPANGEAVTVSLGSAATGVEIAQVGVSGSGPGGNITALSDVTIRYAAASRDVSLRLQEVAGSDAGGQPTFTLTPAGSGTYRSQLTWRIIQVFGGTDSRGRLELVQGGNVVNQGDGANTQAQLNGTAPAGAADLAIRIRNIGTAAMVTPQLTATFP
ncbi:MAG TPA: hypothetical protein VMZ73_03970 [Acidimicrobiales bacterium]|nr:hypothetical protein [Acidimicrobiales bacterium]